MKILMIDACGLADGSKEKSDDGSPEASICGGSGAAGLGASDHSDFTWPVPKREQISLFSP